MGYRAEWMMPGGLLRSHREVFFHAVERDLPDGPMRLLVAGVQNGGSVVAWRAALPEGSVVVGMDDVGCGLPGILEVDWSRRGVLDALGDSWFEVVVCPLERASVLWPFLVPGGRLVVERVPVDVAHSLVDSLYADVDGALPTEEVMRLSIYPGLMVVEKRNPRVIAYIDVAAGVDGPRFDQSVIAPEGTLMVGVADA